MSRDVYSSVSALTVSCAGGASSSSASGGSGESGMSVNSGRCFSFTTRSDFGTARRLRHDDDGLALDRFLASLHDDCSRSARRLLADLAVDALARAAGATQATRRFEPAPMRSMTRSHEMPKSSDQPTANSASSSSVAPLKPSSRASLRADHVAERAARRHAATHGELVRSAAPRARRSRAGRGRSPAMRERQRMIGSRARGPRDAAIAGDDEHDAAD